MNTLKAQRLAVQLLERHGLFQQGWVFRFDNAVSRFGVTHHRKQVISLSRNLTSLNTEDEVRDTLLHEIDHALVGIGHGHDRVWKRKALEIGCNGQRGHSALTPPAKYIGKCPNGHEFRRQRRTRDDQSCPTCCPHFNRDYIIKWQPNPEAI